MFKIDLFLLLCSMFTVVRVISVTMFKVFSMFKIRVISVTTFIKVLRVISVTMFKVLSMFKIRVISVTTFIKC